MLHVIRHVTCCTPAQPWYAALSPGQQQLLAFGRVLYHRPALVLLDEATSALSPQLTRLVYRTLRDMGCAYLSVSHDEAVAGWHDQVLVVAGDGETWSCKQGPGTAEEEE